ncbi:MAG TPA: nucleotide sugar dehydrogenase, partial [Terriglobia bacterium]|nr:nucleotide sugar dehydrogenase [Terriglobia bacterium]
MSQPAAPAPPWRVSVFGLGYVGSVVAACLARLGHHVLATDLNPDKVDLLNAGRSPIVEPGMEQLVAEERRAGRLGATRDPKEAVAGSDVSLIAVGSPSRANGDVDLGALERVSRDVGEALAAKAGFHTVAIRSTVLPGTIESVIIPAMERASSKGGGAGFAVCSNPEFMREGSAVADFFSPPFTVLGARDRAHLAPLVALYAALPGPVFETSLRTAEMVKYVSNAFHAVKVAFANEIGTLCRESGVDAGEVMKVFRADTKLNVSAAYLRPGFAFGGSCLPKDLRALTYRARQSHLNLPLLESILISNQAHIERAIERILAT